MQISLSRDLAGMAIQNASGKRVVRAAHRAGFTVQRAMATTRCLDSAMKIYEALLQSRSAPVCESLSADGLRLIHQLQSDVTQRLLGLNQLLRTLEAIGGHRIASGCFGKETIQHPEEKVIRLAVWRAQQSNPDQYFGQAMEQLYNACGAIDSLNCLLEQKLRDVLDTLAAEKVLERGRSN
jgi:hypothetical protein